VTIAFLADEDLDADIVDGLRSREPALDIVDVKTAALRGTKDPDLIRLSAFQNRVLITHDRRTMPRHFREWLAAGSHHPGLFVVRQRASIGVIVESLLLAWGASQAEEWYGRIVYLPLV
jgi:hypothetical protein